MTDPVPSKGTCSVCDTPDGDHLDWCTPQAREQRPSKDLVSELRGPDEAGYITASRAIAANEIEELRRENVRWENAHKILLAENERLRKQVAELSVHAEKWVKRALGGAAPEPAAARLPIPADWDLASRLNVVYNRLFLDCRMCEQEEAEILYAAIGALRAAQPPGAGQA